MNPEQNQQPNPVDQPPQPTPINPIIISPPEETVSQQPTPSPIIEPMATPVASPVITQPTAIENTRTSSKKPFVLAGIVAVVIILAVSGFVAASMINSNDASKDQDTELTKDDSQSSEPASDTDSEKPAEDSPQSTDTDTPTAPDTSLALMQERDTERKYELKNAQQQLESYFNDNGEYPADWTVIISDPDGRTGPSGDPYTYVVAADLQTYTLTANLENDSDPKADANGNYVILSVNQ